MTGRFWVSTEELTAHLKKLLSTHAPANTPALTLLVAPDAQMKV
jgi:hypothetical protein